MTRLLRFVPEGHVVEVTCRTIQSRFLTRPSLEFEDIATGVLGRTQEKTGMVIHGYCFLSNHYHLLLSPLDSKQLARFMCLLNSKLGREIARLYDWHDCVLGRRYSAIVVARDEPSEAGRLKYVFGQGCKEGLIGSPREWPGASSVNALLTGEHAVGTWFDRTREYRARQRGAAFDRRAFTTRHRVVLSPLPCWRHLTPEEYRRRMEDMVSEVEVEAEHLNRGSNRRPLGSARVCRVHPHDRPRETKRSPAPAFHAITRAAREKLKEAYRFFVEAYRSAAKRLAQGDVSAAFPACCFPPPLPYARSPAGGPQLVPP